MNFSLIVCTYMRPKALLNLLNSVKRQTLYPNEIIIVDGSLNTETQNILNTFSFENLHYFLVDENNRGLTKQRNYGIEKVSKNIEVICFLDDDIILENDYFEHLIESYKIKPKALAVGGYIVNEVKWQTADDKNDDSKFYFDGFMREEPFRFKIRKKLGLNPNVPPGWMPAFSHARSISFLPPSNKIYRIELLMGGVSSYKKEVFKTVSFSKYFEGYGLYEDADFSLRLAKKGELYVNTSAKVHHYHEPLGRPNQYKYGKMVVKNGFYIWRLKEPKPNVKNKFKWHAITLLLILIRLTNVISTKNKSEVINETFGRTVGWLHVLWNKK